MVLWFRLGLLLSLILMMVLSYFLGQNIIQFHIELRKFLFLGFVDGFNFISVKYFNYNVWLNNILFLIYSGILLYSEKNLSFQKLKMTIKSNQQIKTRFTKIPNRTFCRNGFIC